ncbi:MAG: C39 family peptidase, partial [Anaerolineae bacterium]|nr:C39 family peptidase [Anaerolineae bacterium]
MARRRILPLVLALLFMLGVSALVLGVLRYGGPRGLILRVRAEFGLEETRDPYVPTPLPTPTARPTRTLTATPTSSPTPADPDPTATSESSAAPSVTSTATGEPSAPPSVMPTATSTDTARPTFTATTTPAFPPSGAAVALSGLRHEWQTWNNCGPATLSMYLSYYGSALLQDGVRQAIRPNWEDKHADPYEMAEFARGQGLNALVRVNGDAERLRLLLSNGMPVMVATWHIDSKGEQMGHYRLITGYDDVAQEWIVWDSLETRGVSADKPYVGVRLA